MIWFDTVVCKRCGRQLTQHESHAIPVSWLNPEPSCDDPHVVFVCEDDCPVCQQEKE